MPRPKLLFFDVNETLLDLNAMKTVIGDALGSRPELLSLWFTTMLHYSLVVTLADQYKDFGELGFAALLTVARNHGVTLSPEIAQQAVSVIRSLPAHPDVRPALEDLENEGFRMVTLTNSSQAAVDAQIQNAGLTDLFEQRLSVQEVQLFKPHSHVYRWAARKLGFAPEECMLVAAHGWDVAGAIWAGCRAAFISRPGAQLFPLAPVPEIVEPDMLGAARRLIAMEK
ncbi:MAG: haloacid dehalogenase type II [Verrucomicrobia bacterium]|nr:haloacid dehalogenase type II [Verrucomicrobiota bacterium]